MSDTNHIIKKCLLSYQTGVAVIKAKLSGYIPVCVVLDDGHIGELDRATEMVKLELQTRCFLQGETVVRGERSLL